MAKNTVRTLQGKPLDMEKIILKNEKTRAVGNMNVDARGDVLGAHNETVATSTRRVSREKRRQIERRVQDAPVMNSIKAAKIIARRYMEQTELAGLDTPVEPVDTPVPAPKVDTPTVKPEPAPTPEVKSEPIAKDAVSEETLEQVMEQAAKPKGLAGAIAKAREVKQEPLKTPREEARSVDGVKKF